MSTSRADSEEAPPSPTTDQGSDIENKLEAPSKEPAAHKLTLEKARFFANAADALPAFKDRLGGGGFGDLFIRGSKATVPNGHAELFNIIRLLEKIQEDQSKIIDIEAKKSETVVIEEADGDIIKPGKMNGNMIAAMRALIKAETGDRIRDLEIKNENFKKERLEDRKQIQQLEAEIEGLKSKVKKNASVCKNSNESTQSQHEAAISRVETYLHALDKDIGTLDTKVRTNASTCENFNDSNQMQHEAAISRIEALEQAKGVVRPARRADVPGFAGPPPPLTPLQKEVREREAQIKEVRGKVDEALQQICDLAAKHGTQMQRVREWIVWAHNSIQAIRSEIGLESGPLRPDAGDDLGF